MEFDGSVNQNFDGEKVQQADQSTKSEF